MKTRVQSIGFFTNLVNLVVIAFAGLGVTFGLTAEDTIIAFVNANYEVIFSMVIPSVIAAGFKIYEAIQQKVNIVKTIVNSPNFWNQAITTVLSLVTIFVPIVFPENAGERIYSAFQSMQLFTIISVVAMNLVTPILYYLKDRKAKQVTT